MSAKKLVMGVLAIAVSAASVSAIAANSWTTSPITDILVQDDGTANATGLVQVTMPTNMTYVPSCHTGPLNINGSGPSFLSSPMNHERHARHGGRANRRILSQALLQGLRFQQTLRARIAGRQVFTQ